MLSDLGNINKEIADKFYNIYNKIKKNMSEFNSKLNSELNSELNLDLSYVSIDEVIDASRKINVSISENQEQIQEIQKSLNTSTPTKAPYQSEHFERKTRFNQDIPTLNVELFKLEDKISKLKKQLTYLRIIGESLARRIKYDEITELSKEHPIINMDDKKLYEYMGLNENIPIQGGSRKTRKTKKSFRKTKASKKSKASRKTKASKQKTKASRKRSLSKTRRKKSKVKRTKKNKIPN